MSYLTKHIMLCIARSKLSYLLDVAKHPKYGQWMSVWCFFIVNKRKQYYRFHVVRNLLGNFLKVNFFLFSLYNLCFQTPVYSWILYFIYYFWHYLANFTVVWMSNHIFQIKEKHDSVCTLSYLLHSPNNFAKIYTANLLTQIIFYLRQLGAHLGP